MIKKILLTLGLIGLGIINFSYGRYDERGPRFGNAVIGTEFTNVHEQYLTLYVDKDINFKSTKGATEKNIFAVYAYQGNNGSTAYWFYWNTRGELSAYARDWQRTNARGGKLTYYYVCDNFELPFTNFTGCVEYLYTGADIGVVNNYLSFVNNGDDIIYGQLIEGSTVNNGMFSPFIAFNIPNKNKSIVFYFKPFPSGVVRYNLPYRYSEAYGIDNEYNDKYHIEEFPDSLIGESPISGGFSDSGTGLVDISYKCTKEIALKWYEKNGYSSKLCYGGFDNFNLFTGSINDLPFYGSGLDIEEIWFNTAQYRIYGDTGSGMGYNDWFHYWRLVYNSYYRTVNQGGLMENPFNNTPLVLFTYFSAVNQFGRNLKDKDILEYCDLKLYTVDYSAVYSGNYGNRVCSPLSWIEESIDYLNSSGNVNIGVNIGSGSNGSGNSGQNFTDGQSFIQSFVQFIDSDKFKGTNTGSNGIIPGYIVLVLCALLLFRFLMH